MQNAISLAQSNTLLKILFNSLHHSQNTVQGEKYGQSLEK